MCTCQDICMHGCSCTHYHEWIVKYNVMWNLIEPGLATLVTRSIIFSALKNKEAELWGSYRSNVVSKALWYSWSPLVIPNWEDSASRNPIDSNNGTGFTPSLHQKKIDSWSHWGQACLLCLLTRNCCRECLHLSDLLFNINKTEAHMHIECICLRSEDTANTTWSNPTDGIYARPSEMEPSRLSPKASLHF